MFYLSNPIIKYVVHLCALLKLTLYQKCSSASVFYLHKQSQDQICSSTNVIYRIEKIGDHLLSYTTIFGTISDHSDLLIPYTRYTFILSNLRSIIELLAFLFFHLEFNLKYPVQVSNMVVGMYKWFIGQKAVELFKDLYVCFPSSLCSHFVSHFKFVVRSQLTWICKISVLNN